MRIIAGKYKGRRLKVLKGRHIRPTTDRVREALFSILGDRVPGSRVLDLFAGTGALGLEALSRGAETVIFVERSPPARDIIKANIAALGLEEECEIIAGDYRTALRRLGERGESFNLIMADPPYRTAADGEETSVENLLSQIDQSATLREDGIVVIEQLRGTKPVIPDSSWHEVQSKRYGRTGLSFYKLAPSALT